MNIDRKCHVQSGNFLDYFGRNDDYEQHKKAQLASEYEAFKRMDEERFRNRFANKKRLANPNDSSVIPAIVNVTQQSTLIESPTQSIKSEMNLTGDKDQQSLLEERINSKLDDLLQRIDALGHNPPQIVLSHENSSSQGVSPAASYDASHMKTNTSNSFEMVLQERLKSLHDAEQRLLTIECEYNVAKRNLGIDVANPAAPVRSLQPISMNPIPPFLPAIVTESVDLQPSPSDAHRTKYEQQERYRRELDQQVMEAKQKRKAEAERDKLREKELPSVGFMWKTNKPQQPQPVNHSNDSVHVPYEASAPSVLPDIVESLHADSQIGQSGQKDNARQDVRKSKYAEDLRKQIEEDKMKKALQKKLDDEYDRKIDEQCKTFYTVTNSDNSAPDLPVSNLPVDEAEKTADEVNFARGGHGIFGNPLSVEQKNNHQQYKEELTKQIEERRRQREANRQKELEAEQKEAERVLAEQMRLQKEFEEEQRRTKQKVVSDANQDAPSVRPKTLDKTRSCEETKYLPPIDTVPERPRTPQKRRHKITHSKVNLTDDSLLIESKSKAQETDRTKSDRVDNVLKQLSQMRDRLNAERSRLLQSVEQNVDENPSCNNSTRRMSANANKPLPKLARKCEDLFERNDNHGIGIKRDVTSSFPKPPPNLDWNEEEFQQDYAVHSEKAQIACLKEQDDYLDEMVRNLNMLTVRENMNNDLLQQQDNFIHPLDYSQISYSKAEISARPQSPSQVSLNVEEFTLRNEERLKRLEAMQLLTEIDTDPEAVLQRFVKKYDASSTKRE